MNVAKTFTALWMHSFGMQYPIWMCVVRWPVRAIPLPICEFPKSDFSKQLLLQTATFPNSDLYKHELSVPYTICSISTNAGSGAATNRKPRCETKYLFAVGPGGCMLSKEPAV